MTVGVDVPAPVLARAAMQHAVYSAEPRRADLYDLGPAPTGRQARVRVHRNVAAERLITPATPFAAFAGLDLHAEFGPYDDSFSFVDLDGGVVGAGPDVELLWCDVSRLADLSSDDLATFLTNRITALRGRSDAPILVLDLPPDDPRADTVNAALTALAATVPAVLICPLSQIAVELGDRFGSTRAAELTAVPLSARALSRTAQALGLQWLPAALGARIRGLALDLDNTLYDGVLAEDGVDGIVVSAAHRALIDRLQLLHLRGFFLAVVSRNAAEDVATLFATRPELAQLANAVDVWDVSWGPKSAALARIADALRVSPDTLLFIDDNAGELAEVAAAHSGTAAVHASDPATVVRALELAPGMFRFTDTETDALRIDDFAAERRRGVIRDAVADPAAYLRTLDIDVQVAVDDRSQLHRLAELAAKTNQFNTALARTDEVHLADRMRDDAGVVVAVSLRDRLADSGNVGLVTAHRRPDGSVLVDEVCISCRALGRGIEKIVLDHVLQHVAARWHVDALDIAVADGPRNGPARDWLAGYVGEHRGGTVRIATPVPDLDAPITVSWRLG